MEKQGNWLTLVVLEEIEQVRGNFLKYTREAFLLLPPLEKPRILDVGCGSGIPAMELAKLTEGEITGIDIDQSCINEFKRKIEKEWLSYRVKALRLSASEMNFSDETFDVIWSEGAICKYSFEKELKNWRKLLKRNGYLVIHHQISQAEKSTSRLSELGYSLVGTVKLPNHIWWTKFYKPLKENMGFMLQKYEKNAEALKLLGQCQSEINMVKQNPRSFNTAFYIMKKT